jgi:hypothetical protein
MSCQKSGRLNTRSDLNVTQTIFRDLNVYFKTLGTYMNPADKLDNFTLIKALFTFTPKTKIF